MAVLHLLLGDGVCRLTRRVFSPDDTSLLSLREVELTIFPPISPLFSLEVLEVNEVRE